MLYYLPAAGPIHAQVVDAMARPVARLATGKTQRTGPHTLAVPPLAPGLYIVRLVAGGTTAYQKLVVD